MPVTLNGSGQIIAQIKQNILTSQITISGAAWNPITGYSVNITPTSSSNRILIIVNTCYGVDASSNYDVAYSLYRNGSVITGAQGNASGSRLQCTFSADNRQQYGMSFGGVTYIDSPATTSSTTYALYSYVRAGTCYINREWNNSDDNGSALATSSITVMEISGT
jgi:hypothetical protein